MEERKLNKTMIIRITILLILTTYVILNSSFIENKSYAQQSVSFQRHTMSSIPHNAKGHQSHQIVNFQNLTDDTIYKGTVVFNSTKPVDIISYTALKDEQNTNSTIKIWEVGDKKFIPNTLLRNSTHGTVSFEGNGVMAHSTQSNPYKVTFVINASPLNNTQGTIVLGPLLKIFR